MTSSPKKHSHWPLSVLGGVTSLFNLFLPLSLVRLLTPSEVGEYRIYFFYISVAPLFALSGGIPNGLLYWAGKDKERSAAFRSSWSLLLVNALVVLALGSLFEAPLSHFLGWKQSHSWMFIWTVFITIISTFYEDSSIALGKIWRGALFNSCFDITRNALIIAGTMHFRSVEAVFAIYVIMMTIKTALGFILGYVAGDQKPLWDKPIMKAVIVYSAPVSIASVFSLFTNYGDQLILSRVLTAAQFATYSLGCLTVPPLLIFEASVNRVLIPNLSNAFNSNRNERALALYRESVGELARILIPATAGLCVFAKPIVVLLFKERYIEAAAFLQIYAFSYLMYIIPYDGVARARGQGNLILKVLGIFAPISFAAVLLGLRCDGAMGVLISLTAVQFLMRFGSVIWVSRSENWKLMSMIPWTELGRYVALSAIGSAVAMFMQPRFREPLLWLISGGIVFCVIYFSGTARLFLKRAVLPT